MEPLPVILEIARPDSTDFNQDVLGDLRAEKDFRHAACRSVAEVTLKPELGFATLPI